MEIIIDASALIAVIANEPKKTRLIQLTDGAELVAPASVHWEIGNAFSAMLKRNRVSLEQAQQALVAYKTIPIRYVDVELFQSMELASDLGIYAYDAYLLAAALQQRAPLLTLDRGLSHAAKSKGIQLVGVTP